MAEESETMESDLSNNDTKPNMEDFMNNMPTPEDLQIALKQCDGNWTFSSRCA